MSYFLNGVEYSGRQYGSDGLRAGGSDFLSGNVSSSRNVSSSPSVSSAVSQLQNVFNGIAGNASANSALSNQYAKEQREWSANQAAIARDFNAQEAAKNRDWQQMMSNTAHQREVADLKAAGLNPVLSAMNGQGAAVTSGAAASASLPSGDSGSVDTSGNASLVALLSSFLGAQTQLQMADLSARTNEAVAEKYTSMSKIVAELQAATQMRGQDLGLQGTQISASAQKAAASIAAEAAKYGYNLNAQNLATQLAWQSEHPNNFFQVLNEVLAGAGTSVNDLTGKLIGLLDDKIDSKSGKAALESYIKDVLPNLPKSSFGS